MDRFLHCYTWGYFLNSTLEGLSLASVAWAAELIVSFSGQQFSKLSYSTSTSSSPVLWRREHVVLVCDAVPYLPLFFCCAFSGFPSLFSLRVLLLFDAPRLRFLAVSQSSCSLRKDSLKGTAVQGHCVVREHGMVWTHCWMGRCRYSDCERLLPIKRDLA